FGAAATYWATPGFGVRLHGAYFPTQLPQGDSEAGFEDGDDEYVMNNWLYDLNLVFRPAFLTSTIGSFLANPYLFLGGGGLTTNIAGLPAARGGVGYPCVNQYRSAGVCLSQDPEYASVGQGNVGIGFDLLSLAGLGVFGEVAVHGYDSPAHVYNENTAQDKFAFTPRASLGLKFGFGGAAPEEVIVPPVAPPPPPPALPAAPEMQTIRVCVVEGTALREVEAMYNPATGDTTVAGQAFATAYPATTGYAGGATWYINNEPITINGRRYVRFGLPRVVSPTDVTRTGEYQGVGVFTDASATGTPDVIYIPVRPGCEFQPFQYEVPARGVRG
ncbi:MAG TPA: hypothetical protein VGV85_12765, partial [Longimicrobiaceae bacterium]|nr:hypothetical protein [Longimicrobiaceae bacterium]